MVFLCRGYSAVAVLVDILRYAAPHIGIRPTSVKRFSFFAGIKTDGAGSPEDVRVRRFDPPLPVHEHNK